MIQQFICFSIIPTIVVSIILLIIFIESVVLAFLVLSVSRFWIKLDVGAYIISQSSDTGFIKQEYVSPLDVDVKFPEKK